MNVDLCLPEFSATKSVIPKCHIDKTTNIRYDMILDRKIITALGLGLQFYDNVMVGTKVPYEWCSATMVDVSSYEFTPMTDETVKLEESLINFHVDECLE